MEAYIYVQTSKFFLIIIIHLINKKNPYFDSRNYFHSLEDNVSNNLQWSFTVIIFDFLL